jgi:hypothetical protein
MTTGVTIVNLDPGKLATIERLAATYDARRLRGLKARDDIVYLSDTDRNQLEDLLARAAGDGAIPDDLRDQAAVILDDVRHADWYLISASSFCE